VAAFRSRPLDSGPYPYLWLDALAVKAREDGRVTSVATVVATAVSADGHREILGLDTFTAEDGVAWTQFLRGLAARGLSGTKLVISDDHKGLVGAIAAVLPGCAWQRCRTHFMRNVLCRVPRSAQPFVATLVRTIFAQPSADEVQAQLRRVTLQLEDRFADVARMLGEAAPDITAFSSFPVEHWRQIWSNNPQERLNREIRRRSDVVGIFPDRSSIIRLVGAVLAEQHDEWQVARRYMSQESLEKAMQPPTIAAEIEQEEVPMLMAS
jgi:transposase-like protein